MQKQNTVLLAGNSETSRREMRRLFENSCSLLEVQSFDQVKLLLEHNAELLSLILIDISSGGGLPQSPACQAIRYGKSLGLPVAVIADSEEQELQAYLCGASDVIRKPFLPLALRQRAFTLMEVASGRRQLKSMAAIQEKAEKDALTGLFNRWAVRQHINQLLSQRTIGDTTLSALLMIDLDNFKSLNDTYGHLFGDEVLTQTAAKIRSLFRTTDIIGRIGGDEFIVYMHAVPDIHLVEQLCQQLADVLQETFGNEDSGIQVSGSIGAALIPEHGITLNELYHKADQALYTAKNNGKNCFHIYAENEFPQVRGLVSAVNTRIDSDEHPGMADNSLVHFVFQRLYETGDVFTTIKEILGEVGRQMNVSRVYIFENNPDNTGCSNTFEWCNREILPQIDNLQNISYLSGLYENWPEKYDENGVFYCADVSQLGENYRSHLEAQGIKSMLHSAILDNGVFRGFIGFDECVTNRFWTTSQIDTLVFLSKVLSLFLLKKRSQDETQILATNLESILDNQNAWIYVIDPETFRLRYVNQRTRAMSPIIRQGAFCYEVLMNRSCCCTNCPARNIIEEKNKETFIDNTYFGLYVRAEASKISWDGKESCLITCRQMTK